MGGTKVGSVEARFLVASVPSGTEISLKASEARMASKSNGTRLPSRARGLRYTVLMTVQCSFSGLCSSSTRPAWMKEVLMISEMDQGAKPVS